MSYRGPRIDMNANASAAIRREEPCLICCDPAELAPDLQHAGGRTPAPVSGDDAGCLGQRDRAGSGAVLELPRRQTPAERVVATPTRRER